MTDPTRRDFLAATAAAGAAGFIAPAGFGAWESLQSAKADKVVNIGLIGAGGRGSGAANDSLSINPNVRIVAIADLDGGKAKGVAWPFVAAQVMMGRSLDKRAWVGAWA